MAASTTTASAHKDIVISKRDWERDLNKVNVSKDDLNKLVLDYLIIEGYRDAALSFAQELQDPDQQPTVGADDGQTRPTTSSSLFPGGDLFDFDSIHERMLIREAVESGRVDEAVRRVNELDSEILDTNPPLLFHLQLQRFIELIRHGDVSEALTFASTELAPRGAQNPEFLSELEKTMALLAFPELAELENSKDAASAPGVETFDPATGEVKPNTGRPSWAKLGGLLKKDHRTKVAKELNAAILESQGQGQETKLSGLVRLMCWGEGKLHSNGIVVPGLDVTGLLTTPAGEIEKQPSVQVDGMVLS